MSCRPSFLHLRRQKPPHPRPASPTAPSHPTTDPSLASKAPNPQLQSPLLSRLPPEIRILIYEHVLVSVAQLQVFDSPAGLSHVEYRAAGRDGRGGRAQAQQRGLYEVRVGYGAPNLSPREPWRLYDVGKVGLLSCCRVVYAESIEILYARNTIDFASVSTFAMFIDAISPQSLHTIRSLSLSLFYYAWLPYSSVENHRRVTCPPQFKFEWKKCCDALAAMQALQTLHVTVGFSQLNLRRAAMIEGMWFEELGRVGRVRERAGRRLKNFLVRVNWEESEDVDGVAAKEEDLPYRLVRVVDWWDWG